MPMLAWLCLAKETVAGQLLGSLLKAYGWSSCCVSENSFVLTVDMKLGVSERCAAPLASFSGCSDEEPRRPWHRSALLVRFGSDWCSADPSLALLCLFICFPHSVNFSTRQLKKQPYRTTWSTKRTAFLPSAVSSTQWQCKWPIISSFRPQKSHG